MAKDGTSGMEMGERMRYFILVVLFLLIILRMEASNAVYMREI